jgi:demethylmenaquinone methyltransferase/2-methoxy-6-polyprenyl-1,4-benzoquinol methylase
MCPLKTVSTVLKETGGESSPSPPAQRAAPASGSHRFPAGEKVERVRDHFDAIAKRYDMMNTLLSFGIHHLWKRTAIDMLGLKEGETVLDLCGGTGDLSLLASRRIGSSGRIVLYDINRMMMEAGRGKSAHAAERARILYVQGDAEHAALASGSFDAAMVGFGIRNLADRVEGLREICRVLKPGGRFVCLEFSQPAAAWFRPLYDFYSYWIMPVLGRLIAGSREAYTYLPDSIRLFPAPAELAVILDEIGFSRTTYRRLTNGIACIHSGTKRK